MVKNFTKIIALVFLINTFLFPQVQKPCSSPEAKEFDFWVGEWQATWEGSGGSNTITKILNGCVIHEEFKADGPAALIGISNSVYVSQTNQWKQTWVDNQGGYLDFIGNWDQDKMILSRTIKRDSLNIIQRMVWFNISENAFDWNWESSNDNGASWKINWKIQYKRKGHFE